MQHNWAFPFCSGWGDEEATVACRSGGYSSYGVGCELTNSYLSLCKDSGRLFEDDVGVHMTDLIYKLIFGDLL